jgi:signal transduction histidine kinase
MLAALLLLATLVRNLSLRHIRRRMRLLEQERRLDKERSRIARDLHDELGATLTEIHFLGSLGVAGAQTPATRERLVGIVERAQSMAKSLDEIVWTVNPANDTLSSTVSYLCSRTRESLGAAGISCRLEVDDSFPEVNLDSERRHHLLMVINEAVNNIMKHSGSGSARLRVGWRAGQLEVAIEDDGRGFAPADIKPGRNGLENMRRRMSAARGSLVIDSSPGAGTRIRLNLPFL